MIAGYRSDQPDYGFEPHDLLAPGAVRAFFIPGEFMRDITWL